MLIIFDGSTILFKSDLDFYLKEKSGLKSNTLRLLSKDELFLYNIKNLTHIRISESSESDCTEFFTRHITDISTVGEVAGKDLFLFSWNSNEVSA